MSKPTQTLLYPILHEREREREREQSVSEGPHTRVNKGGRGVSRRRWELGALGLSRPNTRDQRGLWREQKVLGARRCGASKSARRWASRACRSEPVALSLSRPHTCVTEGGVSKKRVELGVRNLSL